MSDQTITSLIEKLEGAAVGSRELDASICEALILPDMRPRVVGHGEYDCNAHVRVQMSAAQPSRSLDAALALAERVLPGWVWNIDRWGKMSRVTLNECDAEGWHKSTHRRIEVAAEQTPALALCAAILRAQSEARV